MTESKCQYAERWDSIYLCKCTKFRSDKGIIPCYMKIPNFKKCRIVNKYYPKTAWAVKFSAYERQKIELLYYQYNSMRKKLQAMKSTIIELTKNHTAEEMRKTKNIHLVRIFHLKENIEEMLKKLK